MKNFLLVIFELAVVLSCCNGIPHEDILALIPEQGRGEACTKIDETCASPCNCCGSNTYCRKGTFVWYCAESTGWQMCWLKKDMCRNHPVWLEHVSKYKCRKG
nr:venom protein [Lampona murina]